MAIAAVFVASMAVAESSAEERLSVDGFRPRTQATLREATGTDRPVFEAFSQAYATAGSPRVLLRISGNALESAATGSEAERRTASLSMARREVERGVSRVLRLAGASLIPTSAESAATAKTKTRRDGGEWTVRAELERFQGAHGDFVLTVSGVRLADESPIGDAASLQLDSDADFGEAAQRATLEWMRSVGSPDR